MVVGLLVASIVAVPISVSVLYRFQSALPFIAAVLIFAHLPWMAFTLLVSCILTSVRPFRMSFRFASALVGMLPILLYLYLATRGPSDPLSASISPERKLLLAGPWLLAIIAACAMMATIILLARVVNYRPGTVAPVMAVMFATPAVLFQAYVGVDELGYRVLEYDYGPRSERFEPVRDITDQILNLLPAEGHEARRNAARALLGPDAARELNVLQERITRRLELDLTVELMGDRRVAYEACKDFIADHPGSCYVPSTLYIQARALDTRLDRAKLLRDKAHRDLYTDFPHVESEPVWANLLTEYPDSPLAVAAQLRVAQLRLRRGDVDGALAALATPVPADRRALAAVTQPTELRLLRKPPPESSLDFEPESYRFEARRLMELIRENRADDRHGAAPLQALASLDPHLPGYQGQLQRLAHAYCDGLLFDNLVVRWAGAHPDRQQRAARLRACIDRFPDGDALPEAMLQLADLDFASGDDARRAAGIARLRAIVTRYGQTCWAKPAAERLRILEPRAERTASQPVESP